MAPREVFVGTCGFPGSRQRVFTSVDAAEVQESFYNLLGERALDNLRKRPSEFRLTFKAWQATTHPHTSPTWRKMKSPPPGDKTKYGWLKCTKENLWALEKTMEQAASAKAEVVVFQTPSNMPLDSQRLEESLCFFKHAIEIAGDSMAIAWEPRGEWVKSLDTLKKFREIGIIIVTDYLRVGPLFPEGRVGYTRLHGLGGREVNYRYKYTEEDLLKLKETLSGLYSERVYVMFNNVYMLEDAIRFKELISERAGSSR